MSKTAKKHQADDAPRAAAAYQSVQARRAQGKALRDAAPRQSHAGWKGPPDRRDPIEIISADNEGRMPQLIPIRYGRMAASPFAFYRGSAAIMAADLAATPASGLRVQACGDAHVKAILATGDLVTLENVAKASWVCMMAGSDFIKTSTGKEGVNATIPVALTMVRAIREYHEQTGFQVGFKPAGGVSSAKGALQYLSLMKEELGRDWLEPHLFRIGASSLLTDIERQLEHYVTGNYSANHRHAQP